MLEQLLPPSFDLSLPAGQILSIVLFLIPGLNATWVLERIAGRTSLSSTERLLRAVALSVFTYLIASPWLLRLEHRATERGGLWSWEPIIGFGLLLFVLPPTLAVGWAWITRTTHFRGIMGKLTAITPTPTAWDAAFSLRGPYLIRARLKNGQRVGGFYGSGSDASLYPETQELFVEQAWELTEEGDFVEPLPGSLGLHLRREDMDVLEFLTVKAEPVEGP